MAKRRPRSLMLAAAASAGSAAVLTLVVPAVASAAVTIGANLSSSPKHQNSCGSSATSCDLAPISEGGANQVAPTDGVVTRWRVVGGSGPLVLRVMRPQAGGSYLFVSSSAVETPSTTGLTTFSTRQPINAGDYIAVELESATATLGVDNIGEAPNGTSADAFAGPIADGTAATPAVIADTARGYLNADIEPDADHDGFGDETQDQCPTNAATQGPCPPARDTTAPTVKSFGKTSRLSRSGSLSFFLSSNEQATGSANATVSLPKSAKVVRFMRHALRLKAGAKTKVTLRLSKRNAAAVRRALKHHRRVTAKVTVRLKDSAGNVATKRLSLRIR